MASLHHGGGILLHRQKHKEVIELDAFLQMIQPLQEEGTGA